MIKSYLISILVLIILSSCIISVLPKNKSANSVKICLSAICVLAILSPIASIIHGNVNLEFSEKSIITSGKTDYFLYLYNLKTEYVNDEIKNLLKDYGIINPSVSISYIDDEIFLKVKVLSEYKLLKDKIVEIIISEFNIKKENIAFEFY